MTRDKLIQYYDLRREIEFVQARIAGLKESIPKIEKRLEEIEAGEVVRDKVRGGLGGMQTFQIEGVPTKEYHRKKMELTTKKMLLESRIDNLSVLELNGLQQAEEVEEFISSISDPLVRQIVVLRVVDGRSWRDIAQIVGGDNSEDSVRMMFNRSVK